MERIEHAQIAEAILAAPGWARIGITMPEDRLRNQAAIELADAILAELREGGTMSSADQLSLAL